MLKNAKAVVVDEVRDWENKSTKENRKGDIIASYNIRGLRGRVKKRKIKELLWQPKNDLYISSIKKHVASDGLWHSSWGSDDSEWAIFPFKGSSGGLFSTWSRINSSLIFTFISERFVGMCLE
jgi:hypothetical protein